MNLSTANSSQWDKTQSRELLCLFMCVCIALCTVVAHSVAQNTYTHTYNRFTALFPGPLGWASARRELLDFMVQGKVNRGRHIDHPAGRHSIRTNQCSPPPSSPYFLQQAKCPSCRPTNSVRALKATSAFGLGKRRWSSPQWCYLHHLCTSILRGTDLIIFPHTLQTVIIAPMMSIWGKGGGVEAMKDT